LPLVNPIVLDGSVTRERLGELLDLGRESPDLDFKGDCDLARTADVIELAKDVMAMMTSGATSSSCRRPQKAFTRRGKDIVAACKRAIDRYLPMLIPSA
jgi:hypothetical protein